MAPIAVRLAEEEAPTGIVTLIGEHDAYSAARLENELALLVDRGIRVVVDLSDATFVDSQSLSVLLSARHSAETHGLGFTLVLPRDSYTQVHRILELTGLASSFAIFPTLKRAIAAAREGVNGGERIRAAM
jgi:anti-anti-sigma factor